MRLTAVVVIVALLVAGLIPVMGGWAVSALLNSKDGRIVFADEQQVRTVLPSTPSALVVGTDDAGGIVSATVLALSPSGLGGTVIAVPLGLVVEGPDGTGRRLSDVAAGGGVDGLAQALEGLLKVRFDRVEAVDPAGWAGLAAPVGDLEVVLPDPVVTGTPPQDVQVLYPAGPVRLAPTDIAGFLAARGSTESDLARLVRHQTLWTAWLDALAAAPNPAGTVPETGDRADGRNEVPDNLSGYVEHLAAGPIDVETLPVRVPEPPMPYGIEVYEPDPTGMGLLVARAMPGSFVPVGDAPRLRIVDGTGDGRSERWVAHNAIYVGTNLVIASDDPGPPPEKTRVIVYGGRTDVGEALVRLFRAGTVETSDELVEGLDATIIIGRDLAARLAAEAAAEQARRASSGEGLGDAGARTTQEDDAG